MSIERLGPYELGEPLGKGGMGTVYRARHIDTGEPAAVKALAASLASSAGFRDRFEAEIESLKLLKHPGIVRLLGYGEEEGVLFYAMELVEGTSLEEELRSGRRFMWQEVTDFGVQICRALKHAHDHGVIHRDIKPANLLLNSQGQIKIADFGIARLFGSTQLTSAGGVLGTADYMSPEQTDGRNVTEKCDQYSLGGVMYALLAGRPPFRAQSLPEMLQLQRFAFPDPVRRYAPETPEQLERLIMQLLSKDPEDRFPNTLVLARHMEAMRRALSRPAPDDFALSHDAPPPTSQPSIPYDAIALDTTRIEPVSPSESPAGPIDRPADASRPERPSTESAVRSAEVTSRGTDLTEPIQQLLDRRGGDDLEVEPPSSRPASQSTSATRSVHAPTRKASRFRTVDEDALLSLRDESTPRLLLVAQVSGLVAALALLIVGIWYFSRPASAAELYARIVEVADEGRVESLRSVEDQIDQFLERFGDDSRAAEVAGYKEEIELSRLEGRIYRRARRRLGGQSLAPIEQMYLDAIRKAESDPDEAIQDLQSILILYNQEASTGEDATENQPSPTDVAPDDLAVESEEQELNRRVLNCLRLIERRLAQLTRYTRMEAANQLPALNRRLAEAAQMESTDPQRARSLYRAILELFESKPWARGVVHQASNALARLDAERTAGLE